MRQLVRTVFITNNDVPCHLLQKKNVSKTSESFKILRKILYDHHFGLKLLKKCFLLFSTEMFSVSYKFYGLWPSHGFRNGLDI